MIKHIVMWKITGTTDIQLYNKMKPILKKEFENLYKLIPEIKNISFNENVNINDKLNYDLCLYVEFENIIGLNTYIPHPEHLKLVEVIKSLNLQRACIDY